MNCPALVKEPVRKGQACPDLHMTEIVRFCKTASNASPDFKGFRQIARRHQLGCIVQQPGLAQVPRESATVGEDQPCIELKPLFVLGSCADCHLHGQSWFEVHFPLLYSSEGSSNRLSEDER